MTDLNRLRIPPVTSFLFAILSLAVIAIYCFYFDYFKVSYPQHEDSQMATFVMQWDSNSWSKRIDDWGGFTFGHRYYYPRAISLISSKLNSGEHNLPVLMAGGILMSIFFASVFLWVIRKANLSFVYILPILFLLFNPQLRDYVFWALTNQLYPPSLLFAMLAVILVSKEGKLRFLLATICAWIATGSFSSGLLAFPAVGLVLFLRRRYGYLGVWMMITILTFALYFRNYNHAGWGLPYIYPGDPEFTLLHKLTYLLACTGNTVVFDPGTINVSTILKLKYWPSLLLGTFCWSVLAYGVIVSWLGGYLAGRIGSQNRFSLLIQRQYEWFERHPQIRLFCTSATFLLLVTLYMVVVGRTNLNNGNQIFEKRLKLYPIIVQALAYCMTILLVQGTTRRSNQATFYGALAFTGGIWLCSYFFLTYNTSIESRHFRTLIFNYKNNNNAYLADYGSWGGATQKYVKTHYEPAIQQGILKLDYQNYMDGAKVSEDTTLLPALKVTATGDGTYQFMIPGERYGNDEAQRYFVILKNDDYTFLVNLNLGRNTVAQFLSTGDYFIGQLTGYVANISFPEGVYQVGLLRKDNPAVYRFQDDTIELKRSKNDWW